MPKKKPQRRGRVEIEEWEIELARAVASRFQLPPADFDDILGDLYKKLLELKAKPPRGVKDWRAFLARSFFNRAKQSLKSMSRRERRAVPLSAPVGDGDDSLEDLLAAPEDPIGLALEVRLAWEDLTADQRALWGLLVEENGRVAAVARRMGKPVRTVGDAVERLRRDLRAKNLEK